jgi:hypothetical protein
MTPEVWGKHLWFSIHFIAMAYPRNPSYEQRENYKQFYENLWKVIPCKKCSVHYKRHLKELPLEGGSTDFLENNKSLFKWTVNIHNIVNESLGKPQMTLEEAENMYKPVTFQCIVNNGGKIECKDKDTKHLTMWFVTGVIIGCIAMYFFLKK